MNKFDNQFEMISALLDGSTILANTGEKYFMLDNQLNIENVDESEIFETNTLPDYKTSKIYLDRWHNDLEFCDVSEFKKPILCYVGDDIRLVTGYCEKTDRYILFSLSEYEPEYVDYEKVQPVTSTHSLKQFMKV